jgi:hypothetical protein
MEELKFFNLLEGTYYFQRLDVFIKSKVINAEVLQDDFEEEYFLDIELEHGHVGVNKYSKVRAINRPCNMVIPFEWCFAIKNQDGDFIGYIGKPE